MPTYNIKNGDNLTRLAKRFGTTVSELAQANNITDPDKIFVGDTIEVPDQQAGQLQELVKSLLGQQMMGGSPPQVPSPEMMGGPPPQDPRQMMGGLGAMANPMPQGPQGSPMPPPPGYSNMPPVGNSPPFNPSMPQAMPNPQGGLGPGMRPTGPRPDQARTELLRQYGMMR